MDKLKEFLKKIRLLLGCITIYIILIGQLTLTSVASAVIVALITFWLMYYIVDPKIYKAYMMLSWLQLVRYMCFLLFKIVECGVKTGRLAVLGTTYTQTFTYKSTLENEILLNLLANSITLTPGTLTVNRDEDTLLIMQICEVGQSYDKTDIAILEQHIQKIIKTLED